MNNRQTKQISGKKLSLDLLLLFFVMVLIMSALENWPRFLIAQSKSLLEPMPLMGAGQMLPSGGWRLVLDDSFTGPSVDTGLWNTELRWGTTNSPELQQYTPAALDTQNGFLRIQADQNGNTNFPYTSGIIASYNHFYFQYGYIEIRAKVPSGKGLWPALWMLALDRQSAAEIDIMEILGHEPNRVYTTVHYGQTNGARGMDQSSTVGPDYSQAFHTYAVQWDSQRVIWYIDGNEVYQVTDHIPQEPMYIMANLAVGGDWPGKPDSSTNFPANFDIQYIRVWQPTPQASNMLANSSFEDSGASPWYSPWTVRNDLGATFTQDTTTAANDTRASLKASLPNSNSAQPWSVAVMQLDQSLSAGKPYTLTFWAKAVTDRSMSAVVQEQNSPYWQYGSLTAQLTPSWTRYAYTFTALNDTKTAMLTFNLADSAGDVWLDEVSLCQAGANCTPPIIGSPTLSGTPGP